MILPVEQLILQQAQALVATHADALQDALHSLQQDPVELNELSELSKEKRRILDQFAYRYTRMQDDMGNRLLPACLSALGEDIASMAAIDRFNRLEQLGWLPSSNDWLSLRKIRNEFAHDYPDAVEERYARLLLAIEAANQLLVIFVRMNQHIADKFGNI